jgi:hypothetical protein
MLPYVTVAVRAVNEPATEADFVRFSTIAVEKRVDKWA